MARPKKATAEQVDANGVPFLNTDKNTGDVDVEPGTSDQGQLGFDEPVQLGVNAIVVEDDPAPAEVKQKAEITANDDDHDRSDIELVTNGDGTLLRAEPA